MTIQPVRAALFEIRYGSQGWLESPVFSHRVTPRCPSNFVGLAETSPSGRCPSVPLLLRYAKVGFQLRDLPARRSSVARDAPLVPEGTSYSCEDVCESL